MCRRGDAQANYGRWSRARVAYSVVDHENIQRARLRVETRLKAAAKINPAKYGEKLDVNMSGELNVSHLSDAKLNEQIIGLLEKIGISGELATSFLLEPLPGDDDATRH